jgi:hypothetical protein
VSDRSATGRHNLMNVRLDVLVEQLVRCLDYSAAHDLIPSIVDQHV